MKRTFSKVALFAAAFAGVALTSCNNNDEVTPNPFDGPKTKVAVGMSLSSGIGSKAATTEDDVNMGTNVAPVNNIAVVPGANGAWGNPIMLGNIAQGTKKTTYVEAVIPQATDAFLVYGNLPAALSTTNVFAMPSLKPALSTDNKDEATQQEFFAPHALYYYAHAVASDAAGDNKFQVAMGTTAGDWETIQRWQEAAEVGTNNRVKIEEVRYAVGLLAAGVYDKVSGDELTENIFSADGSTATMSWETVKGESKAMTLTGVAVEGQTADFNYDFSPKGAEEITVFGAAVNTTMRSAGDLVFAGTDGKVNGANIYCIAAVEDADAVVLNFQFQNTTGYYLHCNDKTVVAPDGYFYLATTLSKGNSQKVFDMFTTTLVNAGVTDWGKATGSPVETVKAEVGIEINTQWQQGLKYDVDL